MCSSDLVLEFSSYILCSCGIFDIFEKKVIDNLGWGSLEGISPLSGRVFVSGSVFEFSFFQKLVDRF